MCLVAKLFFMKDIDEIIPRMCGLGRVLSKYTMIERKAFDFGVEMKLYPSEVHTLSTVERLGGCGITELAQESGVTKGAASQLVSKLVGKGLLVKESDPQNGSRVIIRTTDTGKIASDRHFKFHMEHDSVFLEYLQSLNDEELRMFDDICSQMNDWMDNYLK